MQERPPDNSDKIEYAANHPEEIVWTALHYADPDEPKHVLARYTLKNNALLAASKKIVIEVPTQREECCHTGGGM